MLKISNITVLENNLQSYENRQATPLFSFQETKVAKLGKRVNLHIVGIAQNMLKYSKVGFM